MITIHKSVRDSVVPGRDAHRIGHNLGVLKSIDGGEACWQCNICATQEADNSERLERYRRLEPMLLSKLAALESKWHFAFLVMETFFWRSANNQEGPRLSSLGTS